jgi:hypothetical protein
MDSNIGNEDVIAKNLLQGKKCDSCRFRLEDYISKESRCGYNVRDKIVGELYHLPGFELREEFKVNCPALPQEKTCEKWEKRLGTKEPQ